MILRDANPEGRGLIKSQRRPAVDRCSDAQALRQPG